MKMLVLYAFALLLSVSYVSGAAIAQGNLAVVIKGNGLISSDDEPIKALTQDLWCQASKDNQVQDITWARFIRNRDRKEFDATIEEDTKKAKLVFGDAAVTDAGKYRCEIRTTTGDLIYGNMFAYTRPVVHTNGSLYVRMADHDQTLVEADATSMRTGDTVSLQCPIIGFPHPNIVWFKDDFPLESGDRVAINKNSITIVDTEESDAGTYRCVGTNQFPLNVDGVEQEFEVKLEQKLELTGEFGWAIPLIVILITLVLLFIIIYSCQAYKRYKADHYNVARQEQSLRRCEDEERGLTKDF